LSETEVKPPRFKLQPQVLREAQPLAMI